jgi:urease accessory protein
MVAAESPESGWHGQVNLSFAANPQGQTLPQLHLARAPLKVQRSFYPERDLAQDTGRCYTTLLHTAGGMVAGDQLSIHLQLQPQAQALVTTAAASKVYGGAMLTEQRIKIQLEPGASLEWLPQETIIFDGANYRQQLQIDLALGASCLGWEVTRFGRTARGERFGSGTWQAQTEVWQGGRPLWIDPQWLPGGTELLDSTFGLAGQPLIGTLFWLGGAATGKDIDQALVDAIRAAWCSQPRQGEAGVTQVEAGIICRYRGCERHELQAWFVDTWQLIRRSQGYPPAQRPRVWPI